MTAQNRKLVTVGLLAALILVVIGTAHLGRCDTTTKTSVPPPEIPVLSPARIENISSGDVFLVRWQNNKFEKFSDAKSPRFDNTKPVVVIIHGLMESSGDEWLSKMAMRISAVTPDTEILAVDWSVYSLKGQITWASLTTAVISDAIKRYNKPTDETANRTWEERLQAIISSNTSQQMLEVAGVVQKIPPVADAATKYLFSETGLNLQPMTTHIIGFSHGAHIGGLIGKKTGGVLYRLTVLDPSTRIVHIDARNLLGIGWDKAAAKFTDMYGSSNLAGTAQIYGHKTFFVTNKDEKNEQNKTPSLWEIPTFVSKSVLKIIDDHKYAPKWYLSTIGSDDKRFGYSIDVTQTPDEASSGTILSSLPKKGEFDGLDAPITNDLK